ncbi:hypothetical protein C8R43DRAFT_948757 [Mycena crocata]|nr:hypothetical protein C8R43DRAFT_948757 [Mycena crocata]
MPGRTWTTPEEYAFLQSKMAEYITKRADGRLWRFWPALFESWFGRFSEHARMGLPVPSTDGAEPELSKAKGDKVGLAISKRKDQLVSWYRHHSKKVNTVSAAKIKAEDSLTNLLFDIKAPRQRPHRPVEVFQKRNRALIDQALAAEGYFEMNEAATAAVIDLAEESDEAHKKRVKEAQAARMLMRTRVVHELFAEASSDELRSIAELVQAETETMALLRKDTGKGRKARERAAAEDAAREPTPEDYQLAIDESPEVLARVHKILARKTGWFGITIYGGPNPRFGGGLSMKTVCFGRTQAGNDFEAAHGSFDENISKNFQAFLKRSFPTSVRQARALQELDETSAPLPSLDGLFRLPNEPEPPAPAPREKPKRIRKSKAKKVQKQSTSAPGAIANTTPSANLSLPASPAFPSSASVPATLDSIPGSRAASPSSSDAFGDDRGGAGGLFTDRMQDESTAWPSGMGPPSSPATAEAAASAERGGHHGATYRHTTPPIDPSLLGEELSMPAAATAAAPAFTAPILTRPVPRGTFKGSVWSQKMPASPTPTSTTQVMGFNFPTTSTSAPVPAPVRLHGLLNRFHHIMDTPTPSAAPRPPLVASAVPHAPPPANPTLANFRMSTSNANAPSETTDSAMVSPNSPARISRISSASGGMSAPVTQTSPAPFLMQTRPMVKAPVPVVSKTTQEKKKAGGGRGRKVGAGESAAKEAARVGKKKTEARGKGKGKASAPDDVATEALTDTTNSMQVTAGAGLPVSAHATLTAAATPTLVYTSTNNSKAYAALARKQETAKKAADLAARKEKARVYNPDGPSDLVILPAPGPSRARRARKPTTNFDGSAVELPAKMSRAQQQAKRNQPSEDALLVRTGRKRAAADDGVPESSRVTKK